MAQVDWKDALAEKPAIKQLIQDIVNQVPETHGARDAFETCLDTLASFVPEDVTEKLAKLDALENAGVDEWEGYDDAMAELNGDDEDDDSEDDEDESDEDDEDEDD